MKRVNGPILAYNVSLLIGSCFGYFTGGREKVDLQQPPARVSSVDSHYPSIRSANEKEDGPRLLRKPRRVRAPRPKIL